MKMGDESVVAYSISLYFFFLNLYSVDVKWMVSVYCKLYTQQI